MLGCLIFNLLVWFHVWCKQPNELYEWRNYYKLSRYCHQYDWYTNEASRCQYLINQYNFKIREHTHMLSMYNRDDTMDNENMEKLTAEMGKIQSESCLDNANDSYIDVKEYIDNHASNKH